MLVMGHFETFILISTVPNFCAQLKLHFVVPKDFLFVVSLPKTIDLVIFTKQSSFIHSAMAFCTKKFVENDHLIVL